MTILLHVHKITHTKYIIKVMFTSCIFHAFLHLSYIFYAT